ncbi:MAG TPA: TolC family protein [Clostridia bacterium]|nr:TolC family protein [Clostridia bacterium]
MWKKVAAVVLVWALAFMGGVVPAAAGEKEVMSLSLEEAIKMALDRNPEMSLNQHGIEKAKVGLREAKSNAKKLEDAMDEASKDPQQDPLGLYNVTVQNLFGVYVTPRQAEMGVVLAEIGASYGEKGLRLSVEKSYYDVLKAEADLANKEAALERAREQLRLAQVSFQAGVVAKNDVMGAQVAVTAGEVELASSQNELDLAMMGLAKALGVDLETGFELTDKFTFSPVAELDTGSYIKELLETDLGVVAAREGLAVAEISFEQVAKIYTPNVYSYRKAFHDVEKAKIQLEQARTDLVFNVRQSYLNLRTAEKAYLLLEENAKFAEETARLASLRYQAGMATRLEMEKAYDQLNETEAQRLSMLYNYNLAKSQLEYGIFFGSTGVSGAAGAQDGMGL